jgi:hypothetical protein
MSWEFTAASVAGSKRQGDESGNEDAFQCIRLAHGDAVAMILADGAGSAAHARAGAQAAVLAVGAGLQDLSEAGLLTATTMPDSLRAAVSSAHDALQRHAKEANLAIGQLATTLIVVIADEHQVWTAQIGDGIAAVIEDRTAPRSLSGRKKDADYVNETQFVTQENWGQLLHIECVDWSGTGAIVALTDGVELLAMQDGEPHAGFFLPLVKVGARREFSEDVRTVALASFLRSDRICCHTDDDKTVAVAVRRPAEQSDAS